MHLHSHSFFNQGSTDSDATVLELENLEPRVSSPDSGPREIISDCIRVLLTDPVIKRSIMDPWNPALNF